MRGVNADEGDAGFGRHRRDAKTRPGTPAGGRAHACSRDRLFFRYDARSSMQE